MSEKDHKIEEHDEVVKNLLPGYIQRRELEVFQLKRLLEDEEFEKIRIIGHNLRGSGGLYSLADISHIGGELETSALAKQADQIAQHIDALQAFLITYTGA
ncbi:MAG: hypothetical protein HKN88_02660 [Gammaproteobacteria bacterium]|nr:Hpt domain-containing protein [Gammaproteobacteria bacterium]NNC96953.1 hypothetical protein [Gammaproteobacteria bacterium]